MPAEPKEPRTRLIEVTTELMDTFGGRTLDGLRLSYEWGDPTGHDPDGDRDIYTPTITATDDGWLREQREQAATEARRDLDVDVLARALKVSWNHPPGSREQAEHIAAEYRRLIESSPSTEEPSDG